MEPDTSDSEVVNEDMLNSESRDSSSAPDEQSSERAQPTGRRLRQRRGNGRRGRRPRRVPPNEDFTIPPSSK